MSIPRNKAFGRVVTAFAVGALVVLACLCCACATGGDESGVAAKFGSHTISEDEVTSYTEDFRAQNGLADDSSWSSYLQTNSLTGKTWREQAIRTLADRILIEDKADELGISANEEEVDAQLAQAKQQAGVDEDDTAAWESYLSARGTTSGKYREDLEFSNVEEQVFRKELNFDDALEEEMCDDYISQNLGARVVRRYSAIVLEKKDKAKGQELLNELKGLSGEELSTRFAELARGNSTETESAQRDGDIGWDFTYGEGLVDPKAKVRYAQLKAGDLYPQLVKGESPEGDTVYRIMLCTGVVNFEQTPKFSQLPSSDTSTIRAVIEQLALASSWAGKCQEYLQQLEDDANIQVSKMPSGLEYDIIENNSSADDSSGNSVTSSESGQ